jgi:hypothetical protein
MEQSTHVWVCAERSVELVRADRIASVFVSEATSDDSRFEYGPLHGEQLGQPEVLVCAQVSGSNEASGTRRVVLVRCPGRDALRIVGELLGQLAQAGTCPGDRDKPSFIVPRPGHELGWELVERLPRDWPRPARSRQFR